MGFRLSIIFSALIHLGFFALAFAVTAGEMQQHSRRDYIPVFLVNGLDEIKAVISPQIQEQKEKISTAIMRGPAAGSSQSSKDNSESGIAPVMIPEKASSMQVLPPEKNEAGAESGTIGSDGAQDNTLHVTYGGRENASSASSGGGPSGKDSSHNIPATRAGGGNNSDLIGNIRAAIERALIYPPLARKRGMEGTVTAEFAITNRGMPEGIRITKSSGYTLLDTAARETIIKAAPLPSVTGNIEIPITFRLTGD